MKEAGQTLMKLFDYFSIDWDGTLKISEENIDYSKEAILNKI